MMTMSGEYLVHHGCAGHLGRFSSADARTFGRGEAVVVRSRRGLELGEVLCPCLPDGAVLPDPFVGELLRPATASDLADAKERQDFGRRLFDDAARRADDLGLALAVIDVEILLDGQQALLHAVRFGPCEESPYLAGLGDSHGLIVRLYDVAADSGTGEETGCGSCGEGGCGNGGCGECGDGCGSCSSGGAAELAAYFSQLREQMEQRHRVALL
jgi:hypothetical protein